MWTWPVRRGTKGGRSAPAGRRPRRRPRPAGRGRGEVFRQDRWYRWFEQSGSSRADGLDDRVRGGALRRPPRRTPMGRAGPWIAGLIVALVGAARGQAPEAGTAVAESARERFWARGDYVLWVTTTPEGCAPGGRRPPARCTTRPWS